MGGMTSPRRVGTENSKTRFLLMDTVERLMLEEGYAAVGVRRVAREAGVAPALVHYYFPQLDDLLLAVLRRGFEQEFDRQEQALRADRPVRALWENSVRPLGAALTMEYMALANPLKAIRAELARHADRLREAQLESLADRLNASGLLPEELPPFALLTIISSL